MKWSLLPNTLTGLTSPITYGDVPVNALQIFPLFNAPDALAIGTQYTVSMVSAEPDTVFHTFTAQ